MILERSSERPGSYPGVAKFGIALEWGSRGRWFNSSHSDHGKGLQTQRFAGFLFFVRVREQSLFHPLLYIGLWLDIIDSLAWSFPFISWHSGVSEAAIKYFWLQEIFMSRSYEQTQWLQQFYQLRISAERTKTAGIV